jgi:arsenite methyltransferase
MTGNGHELETGELREAVRAKYAEAAVRVGEGCCDGGCDPITSGLYGATEAAEVPAAALQASLGCGNPTALAELREGEIVLDLGSGGGIDVLLSARRVGPSGFAYGLDMTDEMLDLARRNQKEAGVENVEFLKGEIEAIPLHDAQVDVVISNCVINLSGDKARVLREAFRVLRPGGRFAVSDVVAEADLPEEVRKDVESFVGCVAGALLTDEYRRLLADAGFEAIEIVPTRRYRFADLEGSCCSAPSIEALSEEDRAQLDGMVYSAFVRARKPNP